MYLRMAFAIVTGDQDLTDGLLQRCNGANALSSQQDLQLLLTETGLSRREMRNFYGVRNRERVLLCLF